MYSRACRASRSRPEAWNRSALRSALKVILLTASFKARRHRELSRRIPVLPAADPATRSRPAVLWITVYHAETRSHIATDQNRAALWSVELAGANPSQPVELRFGPDQPADPGQPLDPDHPRQGLVRLLPDLRPARANLQRRLDLPYFRQP